MQALAKHPFTNKKCIVFLLTTYWKKQIEHQQLK